MASINLSVKTKISWWVKPLISIAGFACVLRIPVSEERLLEFVMRHGVRMSLS